MGSRLLKIAVVYLQVAVAAWLVMGVTHQFQYAPVHAHLALLGWASLALAGLIYHIHPHHPQAARTGLAKVHFWLHNAGLPVFMIGLVLLLSGNAVAEPFVRVGAAATFAGVLMFTINVFRTVGFAGSADATADPARGLAAHVGEWK